MRATKSRTTQSDQNDAPKPPYAIPSDVGAFGGITVVSISGPSTATSRTADASSATPALAPTSTGSIGANVHFDVVSARGRPRRCARWGPVLCHLILFECILCIVAFEAHRTWHGSR